MRGARSPIPELRTLRITGKREEERGGGGKNFKSSANTADDRINNATLHVFSIISRTNLLSVVKKKYFYYIVQLKWIKDTMILNMYFVYRMSDESND